MRSAATSDLNLRAQHFGDVLIKGKEFIEELVLENKRLHRSLGVLEDAVSSYKTESSALQEQVQAEKDEREREATRLRRAEGENREFAGRCVEMEQQNNNLANLYVASHQLHSTLDFKEVLQNVQEIVINFIGSECFTILLADEQEGAMKTIAAEGTSTLPGIADLVVRPNDGRLGQVIATGENYFATDAFPHQASMDQPLAAVPLKIKDKIIGLLVVYQLLQQKGAFSETDYELFSLLAGQAATAIFSAKLYSDAERKLNTIQGFLESLTTA